MGKIAKFGLVAALGVMLFSFQNCSINLGGNSPQTQAAVQSTGSTCLGTAESNCLLSSSNSGEASGICSAGYTGSCSYNCNNGSWMPLSNQCVIQTTTPSTCPALASNACNMAAGTGTAGGSCTSGDTGSCTAVCQSGAWQITANSCAAPPPPPPCNVQQTNYYCYEYAASFGIVVYPYISTVDPATCNAFCNSQNAAGCELDILAGSGICSALPGCTPWGPYGTGETTQYTSTCGH